jgi:hypothetical protein
MSRSKNFQKKIEPLRLAGCPAGFPFQMVGESISPDVKEPELLQFGSEDLLLRGFPEQVNQQLRVSDHTSGSAR